MSIDFMSIYGEKMYISTQRFVELIGSLEVNGKIYWSVSKLGFSIFARGDLKKGDFICDLKGSPMTFEEAVQHPDDSCVPLQIEKNLYLDLIAPGRYFNHSCEPNSGIIDDNKLVAIKDIKRDEQILYDYSTTMDEDHFTMKCLCGSDNCRGIVRDFKHLDINSQKKYLEMGVVMSFIAKQYQE